MNKKNSYDSYAAQKAVKGKNRAFIVGALASKPMLFSDLLELGRKEGGIRSPVGLSRVLDELQNLGIVNQDADKEDSRGIKRKAYTLTGFGKKMASAWPGLHWQHELRGLSAEFMKVHIFMEDVKQGRNVFKNKRLQLTNRSSRLWIFDHLLEYAFIVGGEEFKEAIIPYMKPFAEDKKHFSDTFGKINFELIQKCTKIIKEDGDPLVERAMAAKLLSKGRKDDQEPYIFDITKAAKILAFDDTETYEKIAAYELMKWDEYYEGKFDEASGAKQ